MNAAQIIVDIVNCGGSIYMQDGRLKVKGIPAALVSVVKSHKVALIALLSQSTPSAQSIQNESGGQPDTAAGQPESTKKPVLPHEVTMSRQECASSSGEYMGPDWVCCRDCRRYLPGKPLPSQSLGRCLATANGAPPGEGSGYKACFPLATRRCPQFIPI